MSAMQGLWKPLYMYIDVAGWSPLSEARLSGAHPAPACCRARFRMQRTQAAVLHASVTNAHILSISRYDIHYQYQCGTGTTTV